MDPKIFIKMPDILMIQRSKSQWDMPHKTFIEEDKNEHNRPKEMCSSLLVL